MAADVVAVPWGAWRAEPATGAGVRRVKARDASPPRPEAGSTEAHRKGLDFLERCRAGTPGIRDEFMEAYGALVRFAMSSVLRQRGVTLDRDEIDDLFHGLILSFFDRDCRRLKMYDGRGGASFPTFIRVCATRQTLDHLRHLRRQPTFVRDEGGVDGKPGLFDEMTAPGQGPEAAAETEETLRRLRDLVQTLPPREQLLIRLHFIEGQSIPEVARVLGATDNATHVLKSRLRAKLRELMELDDE